MTGSNKPKRAFILAAGKGTRLRPYTDDKPKPLVPVNGRAILDYALDKLENAGVHDVTINLYYLGDRIEKYLEDRTAPSITFSKESALLDTGGGVKNALETMKGEAFYLINGDALWVDGDTPALDNLAKIWNPEIMDILLLLQPVSTMTLTKGVGDYDLGADGKAVRAKNKDGAYMFGGIRITKTDIFDGTPEDAFSFLQLMDEAQSNGRLYGMVHDGQWHHISTPEDLENVNNAMAESLKTKTA